MELSKYFELCQYYQKKVQRKTENVQRSPISPHQAVSQMHLPNLTSLSRCDAKPQGLLWCVVLPHSLLDIQDTFFPRTSRLLKHPNHTQLDHRSPLGRRIETLLNTYFISYNSLTDTPSPLITFTRFFCFLQEGMWWLHPSFEVSLHSLHQSEHRHHVQKRASWLMCRV